MKFKQLLIACFSDINIAAYVKYFNTVIFIIKRTYKKLYSLYGILSDSLTQSI